MTLWKFRCLVYADKIEVGLVVAGINTKAHDVRFVEDNWESPVHSFPLYFFKHCDRVRS